MLDFPNSPTLNQVFTAPNGVLWQWDGAKWVAGQGAATAYATAGYVDAAVATALHNTGRNLLHNPLFNVAQRGAGPWTTSAGFTADRWQMAFGGGTLSVSLNPATDPIRSQIGDEAATVICSITATGGSAAGDFTVLSQHIENVYRLANKTVTVSFWAAAAAGTPKLGVSIDQSFGNGGAPSATVNGIGQSVTLSTTYQRYSLTFVLPSVAGKTLGTIAGTDFTAFGLWLSSGATNNTRAGGIGVQSAVFGIWGVQIEIGSVATPLEKPDPRYDLSNCQRFFVAGLTLINANTNSAGVQVITSAPFPVTMRATPAIVMSSNGSANMGTPAFAAQPGLWWASASVTVNGSYTLSPVVTASADL